MLSFSRPGRRLLAALLIVYAFPTLAAAQVDRLTMPTIAASAAAAADWASTYHALKHYHVRETNPLLRPFDSPRSVVSIGSLIDAGGFTAWNLTVGRRNERVAAVGLWTMAAFRTYLVIHNLRTANKATRR
jgi:hypothetical protein